MILYLTTADTELLTLAHVLPHLPVGFPEVRAANPAGWESLPEDFLRGVGLVAVRLLGGRRAFPPFDALRRGCLQAGIPFIAWPGDQDPDPDLAAATTVAAGEAAAAFRYVLHGGTTNFEQLLRFWADGHLGGRFGWREPEPLPWDGIYLPGEADAVDADAWLRRYPDDGRPAVGLLFYRAHWASRNLEFVDGLAAALEAAGCRPLPVFCYSLKPPDVLRRRLCDGTGRPLVDALLLTLSFALSRPDAGGDVRAGERDAAAEELLRLDVPLLQAIASTGPSERWRAGAQGLGPLDVALNVALPELDGRIITVPVCFKEEVRHDPVLGTSVRRYVPVPDRVRQAAALAARWARLRRVPNAAKRVALVLTNYPAKNARIGNAVGLDTPASVVVLLRALAAAGYRVAGIPPDGDSLLAALIARCSNDREFLTDEQLAGAAGHLPAERYAAAHAALTPAVRAGLTATWGDPPGDVFIHEGSLVMPGLDLGNVFVGIQPPRGFGENPIAIYHSPDLAPTHHYVAYYRWLRDVFAADAVIHVGKHGTLEWLPGKGIGLSADCFPEAVLQDLPNFYPFIVNNPGEGTQAKRRSHACVVDHLIPPPSRADVYDDLARLEQLLDQYYDAQALDPAKAPYLQAEIWEVVRRAHLDRDLGTAAQPDPEGFDAFALEVDGYLCELKAAQIRGGLHVLGQAPADPAQLADFLYALVRLPNGEVPSLPRAVAAWMGFDWDVLRAAPGRRLSAAEAAGGRLATASDAWSAVEDRCCALLRADLAAPGSACAGAPADVDAALRYARETLLPRLARTADEVTNLLRGLQGRHVPPGPSGAPTRGMADILPTGRNFYSLDPRAVPSRAAWEVGRQLGDALLARYRDQTGALPESVGIVVWGTAAMRTQGDDVAEILWLLGVRPVWEEQSRRVVGIEVLPAHELGRPRIDVTVRISGFFRDAFPHIVALLDDAVRRVAALDEPPEANFVRKHVLAETGRDGPDVREGADAERALYRIFGSKPGTYGSGILPLIESRQWQDDADLARVYVAWSGYAYGRAAQGTPAPAEFRRRLAQVQVATKNQDNREHDIFDSDDYFQEHGGMVATIRALTGANPAAYFGDSADPARIRVRDLADEARRVYRTRVVNPRWLAAMRRHGYKGALEMAATVDFLFGYDATAQVVEDWMYEGVAEAYALDAEAQAFFAASNPWALRDVAERLLEAVRRGLWAAPPEGMAERLQGVLLEAEGWVEAEAGEAGAAGSAGRRVAGGGADLGAEVERDD